MYTIPHDFSKPHPFAYKTHGRIFVRTQADAKAVLEILNRIDANEVEDYMPDDLIAVYGASNAVVYLHKFEMDKVAIAHECFKAGIPILIVDGVRESNY